MRIIPASSGKIDKKMDCKQKFTALNILYELENKLFLLKLADFELNRRSIIEMIKKKEDSVALSSLCFNLLFSQTALMYIEVFIYESFFNKNSVACSQVTPFLPPFGTKLADVSSSSAAKIFF